MGNIASEIILVGILKTKAVPAVRQKKSEIEHLRDIREKIGIEIQDMSFEQLKKFIEGKSTLHPKSAWKKPSINNM